MKYPDIRPTEEGSKDMEGVAEDMKLIRCQTGTLSVASGRSTTWTSAPGSQRILKFSRDKDMIPSLMVIRP